MANDDNPNGTVLDIDGVDDGIDTTPTKRIDYPRLFAVNLGLAVRTCGDNIAELGEQLVTHTPARRRAILFGLIEELDAVLETINDAKNLISEQARNLTVQMAGKE
jgi:hypothetical protein